MKFYRDEDLYNYFTGEEVYGDEVYTPDEYMGERWFFIDGVPDYMVSDCGRIWSQKSKWFVKPKPMDREGHMGVCLSVNGRPRYFYIHRLMAKAFLPNQHNLPVVRHLNDIPYDNDLENLAWGTQKDNHRDCVRNGNYHSITDEEREIGFTKTRRPVLAVNIKTGERYEFRGQSEAARILGLQQANVHKVLSGKRVHTGGYYFEYLDGGDD